MNIVAVGAHPDDIELTTGGTLLRYAADADTEHRLTMLTVSDGARGVATGSRTEEIVATRAREGRAAADALGADYVNLGFPDGGLADTDQTRDALTRALRQARAHVVLAPPPDDYNADHVAVSRAVTAACLWASAPGFTNGPDRLSRSPVLYYCDQISGMGVQPSHYVDIGSVFDRKIDLLRCHASQAALSAEQFGSDLVDIATRTSSFRGLQAGIAHAEAFRPSFTWPTMAPGWLLPS